MSYWDNIIEPIVKTERSAEFVNIINGRGEIKNVVELASPINGGLLQYLIYCENNEDKDYVIKAAFYSFITNNKLNPFYAQHLNK